ncbi:MAG: thiamine phosphate synthase [Dokdonella sp.]
MIDSAHRRSVMRGLYAITDGPRDDLLDVIAAALRGGARVVQYRDKTNDVERRRAEAALIAALCRQHDALFIVNDDVELARAVTADGVHLGETDANFAIARERLGDAAIIGVSCYDSLERAEHLAACGADYLAFGAFYPSRSKQTPRRAAPQLLMEARRFGLPLVAIGGIDADNAAPLISAGADCIAVISALFGASDVEVQARKLSSLFDATNSHIHSGRVPR